MPSSLDSAFLWVSSQHYHVLHFNSRRILLPQQSRCLGGTIGLAQCNAVLCSRVTHALRALVNSGTLSPSDAALLRNSLSTGVSSLQGMSLLPPDVQQLVKDTFQQGTRWAFISLVPWAGVAFVLTLFLSNIRDTDREARIEAVKADVREKVAASTPAEEGKQLDESSVAYSQRPGHDQV